VKEYKKYEMNLIQELAGRESNSSNWNCHEQKQSVPTGTAGKRNRSKRNCL
jgi:hypothetical protein